VKESASSAGLRVPILFALFGRMHKQELGIQKLQKSAKS